LDLWIYARAVYDWNLETSDCFFSTVGFFTQQALSFKIIQGHQNWCQSKACVRLPISGQCVLSFKCRIDVIYCRNYALEAWSGAVCFHLLHPAICQSRANTARLQWTATVTIGYPSMLSVWVPTWTRSQAIPVQKWNSPHDGQIHYTVLLYTDDSPPRTIGECNYLLTYLLLKLFTKNVSVHFCCSLSSVKDTRCNTIPLRTSMLAEIIGECHIWSRWTRPQRH